MNLLDLYREYEADFEKTVIDDRWSRMERYFSDAAVYQTYGVIGRRTQGRAAIFRRMRRELDAFVRRCQWRRVATVNGPEVDENRLLRSWVVTFHIDGAADLMIEGSERITFEDGRIVMLEEEPSEMAERHLQQWIELNPHVFVTQGEPTPIPVS